MIKLTNKLFKVVAIVALLALTTYVAAQQEAELTQFMNNPLNYNPAFAGTNNALSINLMSKQQWIDVKEAPATYLLNIHSPLNESRASIGGSIISDMAGPVTINQFKLAYSFVIRINHNALLSLGLSGGASNYNVNLSKIKLKETNDPMFANGIENAFKPNAGAGLYFYTPSLYIGASMPDMLAKTIAYKNTDTKFQAQTQDILVTAGYKQFIGYDVSLKASTLMRFTSEKERTAYSFALQGAYENYVQVGGAYQLDQSAALLLGVHINKYLSIHYSYDFPIHSKALKRFSSQEISISFNTDALYIYNKNREFTRKAKQQEDALRSIRYF